MFDIGWSELAVIALVALLVIGPKDLPKAMRTAALMLRKVRALASEFQSGLNEIVREAELDELKRDIDRATSGDVKSHIANTIDPEGHVQRELDLTGDLHSLDKPADTPVAESAPAAPVEESPAIEARSAEPAAAEGDGAAERTAKP
jgi:sec-independent protein translocase protein TatB